MTLFIDFYEVIRRKLLAEKTQEILSKMKKPSQSTIKSVMQGSESSHMIIERTELADDHTIRTYVKDGKEPIRIYPEINTVWMIAYYKRFIPLMTNSLGSMGWGKRITTLLAIKYNFKIFSEWFEYLFSMNQLLLKDENWSQPVKEIRRVLEGHLDQNLIDALALIIEYDSAYRYRFQDIIVELNKDNLRKPAKEISRLIDILIKRDWGDNSDRKWANMKKLMKLALIFCPKIKKQIVAVLKDINIDEVKFSKEDIYWTNKSKSPYLFRGMTIEEREAENKINYGE